MIVELLREAREASWEEFVASHPRGSIYHTLPWRAVTSEGFGHEPRYLIARSLSGSIRGVLPLFICRTLGAGGRRLVSVPMRDRGGALADDDETAHALIRRAIEYCAEWSCLYLELKYVEPLTPAIVADLSLRASSNWVTSRLSLEPDVETLWKRADKDACRWAIRKSQEAGVVVREDRSFEAVARFHDLFSRTRTQMGIPPFPRRLFESIHHNLVGADLATVHFCWLGDIAINGMISLKSTIAFVPAYAAPQRPWLRSYPSESMLWHTITEAKSRGFRYYDFGADSLRQEGLLRFKRKFGAEQVPLTSYFHLERVKDVPEQDSSDPRYALARRVWRSLPLSVSRTLGGWVSRRLA